MTLEEINEIKDSKIRNIRLKYWNLKHKAFLNEHSISDHALGQAWDELSPKEEQEIADYLACEKS